MAGNTWKSGIPPCGSPATPATACNWSAASSPTSPRWSGNAIRTLPDFPVGDPRAGRLAGGGERLPAELRRRGRHDAGRQPVRAGGHESGGAEGQSAGPAARRHHDRQRRTSSRRPTSTKAEYATNPLEDGSLDGYRVIPVAMTRLNEEATRARAACPAATGRACKNFFALGMMLWLYDRPLQPLLEWLMKKFRKTPRRHGRQRRQPAGGLQLRQHGRAVPRPLHVAPGAAARRAATAG